MDPLTAPPRGPLPVVTYPRDLFEPADADCGVVEPAVLVADLDLGLRDQMLSWGLFSTRRPERYGALLTQTDLGRS